MKAPIINILRDSGLEIAVNVRAFANRSILLMADFEQGNWLWQYDGSEPPVAFRAGQLIGCSLPLPLKKDSDTWFAVGYETRIGRFTQRKRNRYS